MTEPTPTVSAVSKLNKKQLAFVLGVVEGKADYVAYMEAYGVERRVAEVNATRALSSARIAAALDELRAEVVERVVEQAAIDKQWVLGKLVKNAGVAMRELPSNVEVTEAGKRIETFERYNFSGANKALQLIGEELGMFRVRIQDIPWDELEADDLKMIEKGILPFKLRQRAG